MGFLPEPFAIFIVFVFGLIIGSFLDVLITRFHTGKSINGRSRCLSCGHTLSWFELFPLLSYVILRGRCRNCEAIIPIRLLIMELATGLLFVFVYLSTDSLGELAFGFLLMSLLIIIAAYDIDHLVIPHEFVAILLCISVFGVVLMYQTSNVLTYIPHLFSAVLASSFYGGLWLLSRGKWIGLGDAKLALPLGLLLTPTAAFSMIVLSFWIGACISLCILFVQRIAESGKHRLPIFTAPLTMKSEVPFAPFLIAAFLVVFFQNLNVLALMAHFL